MNAAPAPLTLAADDQPARATTRRLATVVGLVGAALSLVAFGFGMAGDDGVSSLTTLIAALGLTFVGALGASLAWWRPGIAAGLMGIALVGLALTLEPVAGPWYHGLQTATAEGTAAQSAYWTEAPAMGIFIASALLMTVATLLSLLATLREAA